MKKKPKAWLVTYHYRYFTDEPWERACSAFFTRKAAYFWAEARKSDFFRNVKIIPLFAEEPAKLSDKDVAAKFRDNKEYRAKVFGKSMVGK